MTRCMLLGMSVPRKFWPEAVQYAVHILNRSPSVALGDVTPKEKWSNHKPSVEHIRVFGCVSYALVPYEKRIKLDEKGVKCVMLGVSKESKAYRLFNTEAKKIVISRDVRFDENRKWEWEEGPHDVGLKWDGAVTDSEGEEREETAPIPEDAETGDDTATEEVIQTQANNDKVAVRATSGRQIQTLVWMKDYVSRDEVVNFFVIDGEDIMAMYTTSEDPDNFED